MSRLPSSPDKCDVVAVLKNERALPEDPVQEKIVLWRMFRSTEDAVKFSGSVMLGDGQELVGGIAHDSVGPLYWVGVHVEDISHWGNTKAIQLSDDFDATAPGAQGRPFEE